MTLADLNAAAEQQAKILEAAKKIKELYDSLAGLEMIDGTDAQEWIKDTIDD